MTASPTPATTTVGADELRATVARALVRAGATEPDAVIQADHLVEAELRGHASHGARRLPVLVGRLRNGLIVSGLEPELTWRAEAALDVDGRRGFGPVVGYAAVDAIVERAARTGVALATISEAGHLGMTAPYVERMAAAGCVGVALTVSEALVHAWGGSSAIVGTNPIGIGVPTEGEPLVLDMSTAATSAGKILDYAARGEAIPDGWAVDAAGRPTTDASAAAAGAVSPFGGGKGFGLALAFEALVGVLTRTSFGTDVHGTLDTKRVATKGDVLIAISLDVFGAGAALPALSAYLETVRASAVAGGAVTIPGDRARATRSERLAAGIPVDDTLWSTVQELAGGAA